MHFGYNCKLLLPFRDKCRRLAHDYQKKVNLIEEKWISLQDVIIYLDLPLNEMIEQIKTGTIKVKRKKDGETIFGITAAWQYDDCPLVNSGGQCFYYAPHDGEKISCLVDKENLTIQHPNRELIPDSKKLIKYKQGLMEILR